jgi:hypothetical protein
MARAIKMYTSVAGETVSDDALRRIAEQAREARERVITFTFDIEGEAEYGEAVFLEYAGRLAISWNDAIIWMEAPDAMSGLVTWFERWE